MAMQTVNHNINDDVFELWDEMCKLLGPPKYKVLEAAIEVFAALPKEAQYVLKSQGDDDRKAILDHLRELNLINAKGKRA
jgi:hypothetical protein